MKKLIILSAVVTLALLTISCKKDEKINLLTTDISLCHQETCSIQATSSLPITYVSDDEFHAKVNTAGLVEGRYVGKTKIKLMTDNDIKYVNVTVVPKYYLYIEPNIKFGESKSSITNKFGQPDNVSSTGVYTYNMVGTINYTLMVLFDDNDNVNAYAVAVSSDLSSTLSSFLSERYMFIHYEDSKFWYVDGLKPETITKYIVNYLINVNYWVVLYAPYTSEKSNKYVDKISEAFNSVTK